MNIGELQNKIDLEKWLESEVQHKDMCGRYGYCTYCNPKEQYPCASAQIRMVNKGKKPPVSHFSEKLAFSDDSVKDRYAIIKDALLMPKKGCALKSKITKKCECFYNGKKLIAKINIVGKNLKIYLALNPADDALSIYPHRDAGAIKEYSGVPFQFNLTSELSVNRCIKLISMVKQ